MQKRLRRTMMFVPGNNPSMMRDAHIYGADSIMFDLEDSVSLAEKDAARLLVYNALKTIDYGGVEKVVRVNPLSTEFGRADVEAMVRAGADVIRMPKTETAEEITELEEEIERVEKLAGIPVGRTLIMAAIESALGVVNAYKIATASKRMMGIALGAEDYCANLKTTRSKEGSELLLATDPDCDRVGAAVKTAAGCRLITGNEMGIILLDYICRTRLARGTMPKDPVAVTTIVSTDMATPVAKKYGVELRRTLTGFKFIGEQIGKLEAEGHVERYIFGFEESYGYLSGGHVRDKDAVNATLLVCEAAAWYAQQGMTLLDAIEALYKEFGYYRNALCSFAFEGETGMYTMQNLMKTLRADPPKEIAGYAVERVVDYDTDGTGLPRANVLEYHLAGGHKLMVRPSGTEPKIKVYLSAVGKSEAEADAVNAELAKAAEMLMK